MWINQCPLDYSRGLFFMHEYVIKWWQFSFLTTAIIILAVAMDAATATAVR